MDAKVEKRGAKPARERQNGIDRAVEILDALLRLRAPVKIGDLAKRIGAPRSTLYSIVNRLTEAGILERSGTRARSISARRCISMAAPMPTPIRCTGAAARCSIALPRRRTRRPAVRVARQQICGRRRARWLRGLQDHDRYRRRGADPVDGVGPPAARSPVGERNPGLRARGGFSSAGRPRRRRRRFRRRHRAARADGCCMTNGLSDRFTCCLAAPIRDRRGVAVATLCFIVPVDIAGDAQAGAAWPAGFGCR